MHQACLQVRCCSHGFGKLISYKPGRHLEYIKLHHWDVTMMMSVTQESVKSALCMQFPGVCLSQAFFLYFCNKLPFWWPFCLHSYFIFIFLLEAKCLQLDSNFIAINLRKKNGFETFFHIKQFFH